LNDRKVNVMHAWKYDLCRGLVLLSALLAWSHAAPAGATEIRDLCRVKGQEESTIRGLGLVIGLNGTGDSGDGPTMRALARSLQLMGSPLSAQPLPSAEELDELRKVKNVALVMVTATIPATGARRGDKVDCHVAALNGKSLEGGRLAFAALQGPNTQDNRVYGLAEGPVDVEEPASPLTARVHDGCQIVQDIFTPFQLEEKITLILDRHHAGFVTANAIAEHIRATPNVGPDMVEAIDATNIVIHIPESEAKDPVAFIAYILEIDVYERDPEARVTINERTGSIVISGDVEIGAVVVTHNNVTVETDPPVAGSAFVPLDTEQAESPKLARLVNTLNQLKVPTADIIEIIKGIERNGKLHGRLIVE
jgi:flagellar P-ring protein precursor FlgI